MDVGKQGRAYLVHGPACNKKKSSIELLLLCRNANTGVLILDKHGIIITKKTTGDALKMEQKRLLEWDLKCLNKHLLSISYYKNSAVHLGYENVSFKVYLCFFLCTRARENSL